jgi:hypothetical protein
MCLLPWLCKLLFDDGKDSSNTSRKDTSTSTTGGYGMSYPNTTARDESPRREMPDAADELEGVEVDIAG